MIQRCHDGAEQEQARWLEPLKNLSYLAKCSRVRHIVLFARSFLAPRSLICLLLLFFFRSRKLQEVCLHEWKDSLKMSQSSLIGLQLIKDILKNSSEASRKHFDANLHNDLRILANPLVKVNKQISNKIGNAHLKWAFSEAAVLFIRNNDKAKRYVEKLQRRMNKAKALSALAHKLGRAAYFMLKDKRVFDEQRFLKG